MHHKVSIAQTSSTAPDLASPQIWVKPDELFQLCRRPVFEGVVKGSPVPGPTSPHGQVALAVRTRHVHLAHSLNSCQSRKSSWPKCGVDPPVHRARAFCDAAHPWRGRCPARRRGGPRHHGRPADPVLPTHARPRCRTYLRSEVLHLSKRSRPSSTWSGRQLASLVAQLQRGWVGRRRAGADYEIGRAHV